jgi:hypothetical protein
MPLNPRMTKAQGKQHRFQAGLLVPGFRTLLDIFSLGFLVIIYKVMINAS